MRDIQENSALFGGLTVLFAGEWRKILPEIRHAGRPQTVEACLKYSPISLGRMSEYSVYSNVNQIFECIFKRQIFVLILLLLLYV